MTDPKPRSAAQTEASRENGAKSTGPITAIGKTLAGMNAITHGVWARGALMPGESREAYEAVLLSWASTLRPATEGEALIVARIADVSFRVDRLARLEEKIVSKRLEKIVADGDNGRASAEVTAAIESVAVLHRYASGLKHPLPTESLAQVLPLVRRVAELVVRAGPVAAERRFMLTIGTISMQCDFVPAEAFAAVALACEDVAAELKAKLATLAAALGEERVELADLAILAAEDELRALDRARSRLVRELETQLRLLKAIHDLAVCPEDPSGSFVHPISVELRVVGTTKSP